MKGGQPSANDVDFDLGRLFAGLWENWLTILLFTLAMTVVISIWALLSTPLYRAETRILIQTRELVSARPDNAGSDPIHDDSGLNSQVEVVASSDILAKVAGVLDLANHEEFLGKLSPFGQLMVMTGLRSNPADIAPGQRVLEAFREKLDIYRVKDSRVIAILFSSEDPELAAKVPNAIAEAYIAIQQEARLQSNQDAAAWSRREHNYLPGDVRVLSHALVPAYPYFPKMLPMTAAGFAAALFLSVIFILLRELFSGRAMRPAPLAIEPIRQVAMPVPQAVDFREDGQQTLHPRSETRAYGEMDIAKAAELLIVGGMSRAIFVSPEGDEAAAAAILVARAVADAGLRVLLLDLTTSSAASRPMLESPSYTGITNLLASEAQFADVIHGDLYSDCHVIPTGTADPQRAMRAVDRLPIIMDSLAAAYDVVLVECGPADPAEIERLVTAETVVMVAMLDLEESSAPRALRNLRAFGYREAVLVTPTGYQPPVPGECRSSAA